MHGTESVERGAEQPQWGDPDPIAAPALADDHGGNAPSSAASETLLSTIATGSAVAVLCVVEGAWLWLLGTGVVWVLGGQ
jgi:hypothetical protein